MNFDKLKTFHKIALTGSFTKAARKLHLTQSAVSQQIRSLEDTLGITLIDRSNKRVRLTSEGKILLSYAERLFDLYDEMMALFELQQTRQKGKITIGSTRVLGTYFLPKIIGTFNRQYPDIEIDLRLGNSHHILDLTVEDEVDFGFAGRIRTDSRLTNTLMHKERLLIVSSADNEAAARKTVSISDLDKTPFIWREKGTQTQRIVKRWFEENIGKHYPKKSIELDTVEAAKRIVEEGYGITIIPEAAVKKEINAGLLRNIELEGFNLTTDYYLFFLKGKVFSKAAETFLKILSNIRLLSHTENLREVI